MSHLGRPKGIQNEFSLKHIIDEASRILGSEVKFVADVWRRAEAAVAL